jgi:hypothetical protein
MVPWEVLDTKDNEKKAEEGVKEHQADDKN